MYFQVYHRDHARFPGRDREAMVCDADNIADGIYPGSMNYQNTVSTANTTRAATSYYDAESSNVTTNTNDILVASFKLDTGLVDK